MSHKEATRDDRTGISPGIRKRGGDKLPWEERPARIRDHLGPVMIKSSISFTVVPSDNVRTPVTTPVPSQFTV